MSQFSGAFDHTSAVKFAVPHSVIPLDLHGLQGHKKKKERKLWAQSWGSSNTNCLGRSRSRRRPCPCRCRCRSHIRIRSCELCCVNQCKFIPQVTFVLWLIDGQVVSRLLPGLASSFHFIIFGFLFLWVAGKLNLICRHAYCPALCKCYLFFFFCCCNWSAPGEGARCLNSTLGAMRGGALGFRFWLLGIKYFRHCFSISREIRDNPKHTKAKSRTWRAPAWRANRAKSCPNAPSIKLSKAPGWTMRFIVKIN